MPEVSVIIPNYNHAQYLEQRIESVLAQTFTDYEILILDDCSTDHSMEVINRYADHPKVSQIVVNEKNSGSTFLQWQKGIKLATGKYIWLAESDDWCEPSLLDELMNGFRGDENCVISYCQMACILGTNTIKWQSYHSCLEERMDGRTFIKKLLAVHVTIYNASMALFKREAYNHITDEFTTFKLSGDRMFWIQLSLQGNVYISGKTLDYFRKHDQDVSGKAYKSGLNFLEEFRIINWMYSNKLIDDQIFGKAIRKQYKNYWRVKSTIDPANKKQIAKLFSNLISPKVYTIQYLPTAFWGYIRKKD
ncbi:glycosyltransferase family 2 protein [Pedobacter antarcticus]|uniref:glycosyltransferase family 2 protein n=1 Tax=Pedobacter antarcticus TaxID=34086 RepID=UPI00292ECC38|nr:glycosyltransferase family 2 protein [Pedobacter antarcticus]